MRSPRRYSALISALLLATALVACDEETRRNDDLTDLALDFGNARGEALAVLTDQELGPQPDDIAAAMAAQVVMTIDQGEIATAQAALPTLTDPDVIEFATRILAEHGARLERTQELVVELGMTPIDNAVADELRGDAELVIAEIHAAGPLVDVVYMRTQVELLSAALNVAEALEDNVDDDDFDDVLSDTKHMIEDQWDDAIELLRDL